MVIGEFSVAEKKSEAKSETKKVLTRAEIDAKYQWNAESVFASPDAWQTAFGQLQQKLPTLQQYAGKLNEASALADAFELYTQLVDDISKLYVYASMSAAGDTSDQKAQAMLGQVGGLYAQFLAASAFIEPELIALGEARVNELLTGDARLSIYKHYTHNLFRRQAHVRSAEVEELLGAVSEPLGGLNQAFTMLSNADMKFRPAVGADTVEYAVVQGTLPNIMTSPDREARRTAWNNYLDEYVAHKHTFAALYTGQLKADVFFARARGYKNTLEASLHPNNISVDVFHNLIDVYKRNLPTWHRYWAMRKRALGVETMEPFDQWAPLTTAEQPYIPYEKGVDYIAAGMAPLGEEYVGILRRGCLEDRWVDVYPNAGKRAGAFSSGVKGTHPFIMMSYGDDINSMSTLAHELGHSLHSYFTWQNQPTLYSDYSLFVAEVASNFNQAMVRAHLLKTNNDPAFQLAVLQEALYNFHRYFFIMPTLARFELAMHERAENGQPLTADVMMDTMVELFTEAFGPAMDINRDRVGMIWATFPHMYMNYYVFQYATGISGAHALAGRILAGEPNAAEDYLNFLRAGSSMYGLDVLKRAGVDLTTPAPVEQTYTVLADYVDRLEKLTEGSPVA
jgi:oligoendopeptidase F